MQVEITEQSGVWSVRPTEGRFAGRTVATAERLYISNARRRSGNVIVGDLNASWGVTMLKDVDSGTAQGLVGRRSFNYQGLVPMANFDNARHLICSGNEMLGREW